MRKPILLAITLLLITTPTLAAAETAFIVRPGGMLQGASVGLKSGSMTYFAGLDFLVASASASYADEDWRDDGGGLYLYHKGNEEFEGSAKLFVPHLGIRIALGQETVRPYLAVSLFKVIPSLSLSGSETDTYYLPDGTVDFHFHSDLGGADLDKSLKDIEDILGAWGFNLGFGSEYYFAENFSLGGEFALRYIKFSGSSGATTNSDWNGDGQTDYRDTWSREMSATFGVTSAHFSLNYYF